MKRIIYLSAIALMIFATLGCGKEDNEKDFGAHNLSYTDCKKNTSKATNVKETSKKEYLELKANGKYLNIKHVNTLFSCCPEEIQVTSRISNDTIFIDEDEKGVSSCNCICDYDLNYEVGELSYGKYLLVLTKYDLILKNLEFNSSTNEVINIGKH